MERIVISATFEVVHALDLQGLRFPSKCEKAVRKFFIFTLVTNALKLFRDLNKPERLVYVFKPNNFTSLEPSVTGCALATPCSSFLLSFRTRNASSGFTS